MRGLFCNICVRAECVFLAICVVPKSREETGSVDNVVPAHGLAKSGWLGSDSVVREQPCDRAAAGLLGEASVSGRDECRRRVGCTLLAANADPRIIASNGRTALILAEAFNHPAIVALLEARLAELAAAGTA